MKDDNRILTTLRQMAWERAKGELYSMLDTYWDNDSEYEAIRTTIDEFVDDMEQGAGI